MKILTLHQPESSLIASGAKRIVTRTFSTDYRGPVAIHAARSFPRASMQIAAGETFLRALCAAGIEHFEDIPRGVILATAELVDCAHITDEFFAASNERRYGDFSHGRFAWMLSEVRALAEPIEHQGSSVLRSVPVWVQEEIRAQVEGVRA